MWAHWRACLCLSAFCCRKVSGSTSLPTLITNPLKTLIENQYIQHVQKKITLPIHQASTPIEKNSVKTEHNSSNAPLMVIRNRPNTQVKQHAQSAVHRCKNNTVPALNFSAASPHKPELPQRHIPSANSSIEAHAFRRQHPKLSYQATLQQEGVEVCTIPQKQNDQSPRQRIPASSSTSQNQ